jgi:hypothetical protein
MMCKTVEKLDAFIGQRPLTVVLLDQPLLITGDEPVILNVGTSHVQHRPDCFITQKELSRGQREGMRMGKACGFSRLVKEICSLIGGCRLARRISRNSHPKGGAVRRDDYLRAIKQLDLQAQDYIAAGSGMLSTLGLREVGMAETMSRIFKI